MCELYILSFVACGEQLEAVRLCLLTVTAVPQDIKMKENNLSRISPSTSEIVDISLLCISKMKRCPCQ